MVEYININVYQKAIETLVEEGYTIVQIFFNEVTAYYYIAYKFNAARKTPTDDIQFNQVVGINITDFIQNNAFSDKNLFIHKLEKLIESDDSKVVRLEFPNTIRWFKFAAGNK